MDEEGGDSDVAGTGECRPRNKAFCWEKKKGKEGPGGGGPNEMGIGRIRKKKWNEPDKEVDG